MKKSYLLLFFILFSVIVFSQENLKSLKNLKVDLSKEVIDSSKIKLFIKIADYYKSKENDSSYIYYEKAVQLAIKSNSKIQLANAYRKSGTNYSNSNNLIKALESYQNSVSVYENLGLQKETGRLYNNIGLTYSGLRSEDKAIQFYLKALHIYENILNDLDGVATVYINIGNLYYSQENYEFAQHYFDEALKLYKKLEDKFGISICYTNIGNVLADNKEVSKGLNYYFQSIEIQEELKDRNGIAVNYNNIGDCYITLKQYNEASSYIDKAAEIANLVSDEGLLAVIYINKADLNYKQNNWSEGVVNAHKSLKLSKKLENLEYQILNYLYLSQGYEKLNSTQESLNYLKEYQKLKDSVENNDKRKNVELFHALNDLENKRNTIDELSNKNELAEIKYENEKKISYFLIILITIIGLFLIISINLHTSRKKAFSLLEFKNHQINTMNEEIKKQSNKLTLLNTTKDKFFSIIAHDLKNPFNSIQGFSELLIENFKDFDDEKKLKFLKIIKGSSLKASNLLTNLLLWANNQSGSILFDPKKSDLALLVSEAVSLAEIQAINKEISIINNVDNHLFVNIDTNMIETVLRNLISNAIKFTYAKGEIQLYSVLKNGFVEVCIKDNGIGIPFENQINLFNVEVKSTSLGTSNEQGSGLGLILCKDFIEKNGGQIWVESEPNIGSAFKFTLPIFSE